MTQLNSMSKSIKGVFLSILLVSSLLSVAMLDNVEALEKPVTAKSVGFEKTTIVEFENTGNTDVQTFRLWLGSDFSFKSFKTEKGWTGQKTPQGVLVFSTEIPVKPGESVKFGIKTDKEKPGINWKALDKTDEQIEIGKTLVSDLPEPEKKTSEPTTKSDDGILSDSTFRLIPEKPKVGSTIRVTGDSFGANHELDFYLDKKKLDSFETDGDGNFIFTTQIPEDENPVRVEFIIKDKQGNEKLISLRLGESEDRLAMSDDIPLRILNPPSVVNPGQVILVKGEGEPSSTVTLTTRDPEGNIVSTNIAEIDNNGKWTRETLLPLDTPLGKYSVEITDGRESKLFSVEVESALTIQIVPSQIKFDPGSIMKFNGTVNPNEEIEIVLENPLGIEVFSDIIQVDESGFVEFEFETSFSDAEGTYVLTAFQGDEAAITLVGLGELPVPQLVAKMDKLNYKAGDVANIALDGPASSTITLLIINPSDQEKITDTTVLGPDGKGSYQLDLTGYASGVYTTVAKRASSVTEHQFSVGLLTGSGDIDISTTKIEYEPGDSILILGVSAKGDVLITLTLLDPDENKIKEKEIFATKYEGEGKISESGFRIPTDAVPGDWKIKATSGPNFDFAEFDVVPDTEVAGMIVTIESIYTLPTIGQIVNIRVIGATQSVQFDIKSSLGDIVGHLELLATSAGEVKTPWPVPTGTPPGTYTVIVTDPYYNATATFELE